MEMAVMNFIIRNVALVVYADFCDSAVDVFVAASGFDGAGPRLGWSEWSVAEKKREVMVNDGKKKKRERNQQLRCAFPSFF